MAKRTTSTSTDATKKTRTRKPQYFVATVHGNSDPIIVVAPTYKAALAAVLTLKPATATDLVAAGRNGYAVIDTTAPDPSLSLLDAA